MKINGSANTQKTKPIQTQFKPNTKPKQTQFKPNQTQNKANQTQFKAKTNPTCRGVASGEAGSNPISKGAPIEPNTENTKHRKLKTKN